MWGFHRVTSIPLKQKTFYTAVWNTMQKPNNGSHIFSSQGEVVTIYDAISTLYGGKLNHIGQRSVCDMLFLCTEWIACCQLTKISQNGVFIDS